MRARFLAAVLVLGLAATADEARAQSDDRGWTYLTDRMNAWIREEAPLRADASTVAGGKLVGILTPGSKVVIDMYFQSGVTYKIKGICDFDCNDLDLKATGWGNEVSDYAADDFPILNFAATQTNWGHVTVEMPGCSNSSGCHFGVLILRR